MDVLDEVKAQLCAQAEKIEELTDQVGDRSAVAAELQNIAATIRGAAAGLDSLQPKGVPTNPLPEPPALT